jgi:cell division protein FtsW
LSRGIATAVNARDDFGRFLAFGITLLLGLQAMINMLVAVALIPTKGLTLPFVSYGGSSMLVSCFAVGILMSISRDTRKGWVEQLAGVQDGGSPSPSAAKVSEPQAEVTP